MSDSKILLLADEATWMKWLEGHRVDRTPRPDGSQALEDAYIELWHARVDEEDARGRAEWKLLVLNRCLAEVTRIKQEEQNDGR